MFKKKYNLNDRIIITKDISIGFKKINNIVAEKGEIGRIICKEKTIFNNDIYGIEFQKRNRHRHDLKGRSKKGYGFLIMPKYFKLVKI